MKRYGERLSLVNLHTFNVQAGKKCERHISFCFYLKHVSCFIYKSKIFTNERKMASLSKEQVIIREGVCFRLI